MVHPEWALKFKEKSTELRNFNGRYYLYRISSKYDKERKVTKKITHEMLGRITEKDGFIPKGQKINCKTKHQLAPCVKEYGATSFLQTIGNDIFTELRMIFPNHWQQLAILAMNRLIYQSPLKNNEFLYQESFLSETFMDLKLDKNSLTDLIQEVGGARDKISSFLGKYVAGEKNIIFDVTHIFSSSKQSKMSAVGYNSQKDFDPQINLFYMFSVDKQTPLYYRIFPGNISGIKALKLSIQESGANKCVVVGDKGFASEENFTMLEQEKLTYIFPIKRDSKLIDYTRLKNREYNKAFDGHFLYHDRPIFYYQLEEKNGRRTTLFHDPKLKLDEESNYLRRIAQKIEGYNMDGYQEKQLCFGAMSMITNIKDASAEDLYVRYKHRMEIETLFDSYKNLLEADSSYMHSDAGFEAWALINHLSIMLYYKIFTILKDKQKLNNVSPKDLLLKLTRISKVKINNKWLTAEINSKSLKLFSSLNIHVT
jgi:transposase